MEFKIVIGDSKSGKSYQKEIKDEDAKPFRGMKIGDKIKGELLNMTGYEFTITGGSDNCGFPMRRDVAGPARKRILAVKGIGIAKNRAGRQIRKTVAGNTVHANTAQINLKVLKYGKEPLEPKQESETAEEPKAEEKPKEESAKPAKEESKEAEKPAEEEPTKEEKKE